MQSFTHSTKILCAQYAAGDTRVEAWSQSLLSNGFQCQVRGRLENQGILTWGFPEEVKAEPKPGKGDERKKRSVFLAEAAECAETRRQESSPTVKELEEVQCSWVIPWADLKRAKAEAGNRGN